MRTNDEQLREHWRAVIERIAMQLDDFKARIDTESQTLYTKLSAEIARLQADVRSLEAEVQAAAPDAFAKRVAAEIEELRSRGDAAYDLLQTNMTTQLDPKDAEIRRLQAIAPTASADAREKIMHRIDELTAERTPAGSGGQAERGTQASSETPP